MSKRKKIFILDTNVILHDSSCINQFQEHDIMIPITVLEELDHFKKGNQSVNYHARQFARSLDELSGDKLFNGGIRIGPSRGKISVRLERETHPDIRANFHSAKADHHIINIAYHEARDNDCRQVILVTKDVNMRMKAKAVGLLAQDYTTDHIKDISSLYAGYRLVENVADTVINRLHAGDEERVTAEEIASDLTPLNNEYLILRNGRKSALAFRDGETGLIRRIERQEGYGIQPRNAEQSFALHALQHAAVPLVTISGKAGTGKTLLALAAALEKRRQYRQILLARPVVPLSNKDIGYLPGDIHSKLKPYMQPLHDNLGVIRNQFAEGSDRAGTIHKMLENEKLIIEPLAYIRGRSLVGIYLIVDEAQNLTPHEAKTIITRAGEGTKIVFTGDIFQIDHPYLDSLSNGLSHLIDKMQGHRLYAHINLQKGERSELAELASNLL